jgi:hypothetical protein
MNAMTHDQQLKYMATANRVTVGVTWQLIDNNLRRFFVAKVRGIIVSDGDTYLFDTAEAAREFGWKILDGWREEYYGQLETAEDAAGTSIY